MSNLNMGFESEYDQEDDVLSIYNLKLAPKESVQISEDIILDIDKYGKIVGLELFYASEFLSAFNPELNKLFLSELEAGSLEEKEFRNMSVIVLNLKSNGKVISQTMPPLSKSEYASPLLARA